MEPMNILTNVTWVGTWFAQAQLHSCLISNCLLGIAHSQSRWCTLRKYSSCWLSSLSCSLWLSSHLSSTAFARLSGITRWFEWVTLKLHRSGIFDFNEILIFFLKGSNKELPREQDRRARQILNKANWDERRPVTASSSSHHAAIAFVWDTQDSFAFWRQQYDDGGYTDVHSN